jgi:DNA-binding PadR family transcriptional regulator
MRRHHHHSAHHHASAHQHASAHPHHSAHFFRESAHFFGRHHGGRGSGRFGGSFADGGELGGRGFGRGRKLSSLDLQLLILALLAEKPRHGYEIIKALDERSKGFYAPSPGMVYPALTYLEEIGHATVEVDGTRKLYHITTAGREHLDANRAATDSLFAQFSRVGERMDHLRRAMHAQGVGGELGGDEARGGSRALMRARRALKSALADKWDGSAEEQERVAEILRRAAEEIAGREPRE